jgi:hypothetical protein
VFVTELAAMPGLLILCYSGSDDDYRPGDGVLLLRMYVRQEPFFWHEEIASLE